MKSRTNAIFLGSGMNALGLVGALAEAERRGFVFANVAGSSAGAIVATLLATGFRAGEIRQLVNGLSLQLFKDKHWLNSLPVFGPALSLWFANGLYTGCYLENWLKRVLDKKGIRHFRDLERGKPGLIVYATDVTRRELLKLPHDIRDYAIDPDSLEISTAVRMSCAVPLIYMPYKLPYLPPKGKVRSSYVVATGSAGYSVAASFDEYNETNLPTIIFRMVNNRLPAFNPVNNPFDLSRAIVSSLLDDHHAVEETDQNNLIRTIPIPSLGIKTTDLEISLRQKERLYQVGVQAAANFFDKGT
jgi:NTE family protein